VARIVAAAVVLAAACGWAAAQDRPPLVQPAAASASAPATGPATRPAVTFNTNFEGGSVGQVEKLDLARFRVHVRGQHDERGRNRQASWYYFRLDHVRGLDVALTLTDLVGEYNDKPGAVPGGPDVVPVLSEDGGRTWRHFAAAAWDDQKKEMTVTARPAADSVLVAHVPPYTPADLARLLADVGRCPHAVVEVVGRTTRGRDLHLVTVTDPDAPDDAKHSLWLQARQHAWEAGTSYVAEGALRFLTSDDPAARDLRRRTVFRFTPMVDVDGCLAGEVRFNANGYDVNRHWDEVDLRRPELLRQMPEIWYAKKAIVATAAGRGGRGVDLLVNMHNTETAEYLETHAQDPARLAAVRRLADLLAARTSFDPSRELAVRSGPTGTANALSREYGVPVVLMEQRISTGKKLGRRPTVGDRLTFGRDLVTAMADAVR
jgi:hypothetical protein